MRKLSLYLAMDYIKHLKKDKKLAAIIKEPLEQLRMHKNIPLRLIATIMGQQLSTKVAKVIFKRFLELFDGKEPTPQQVLDMPFDQLKSIGLSNSKVFYIQNVAEFCKANSISDAKVKKMSNEQIMEMFTQIKGVGRWSVEMLLMFSLGREDVFSVDDLGIQKAMTKIYQLETENKKQLREKMLQVAAKWSPYSTYACLHLWKWKDTNN